MKSRDELNQIDKLLCIWEAEVHHGNADNRNDGSTVSEKIAEKVLNIVYGYELKNLNTKTAKYPAIDLGDTNEGIAFSITSRKDKDKVKEDLEKFYSNGELEKYPKGIRFLFIHRDKEIIIPYKPTLKKYKWFYKEDHLLSLLELGRIIKQLDDEKFQKVKKILEDEFYYFISDRSVQDIEDKISSLNSQRNNFSYQERYLQDGRGNYLKGTQLLKEWVIHIFNDLNDISTIVSFYHFINPFLSDLNDILINIEKIEDNNEKERLYQKAWHVYNPLKYIFSKFINHGVNKRYDGGKFFINYINRIEENFSENSFS